MTINDDKLMLLEQLTYLNSSVAAAAGIKANYKRIENEKGKTIHDFLNQFTEESLAKLEQQGTIFDEYGNSTHAQGKEWAAIIRALKSEESIKDLVISDVASNANGKTPYNDITVVGHSKGGNKAQYVTVLSDKVTRCVSMDGQGFSNEFLEKYWAEIQKKGSAIKNYSLNNVFVHILLFPVPGSEQLYFEGYGMETGLENHSPNSFFYVIDQDGHAVLKYDENGIYLKQTHAEYNSIRRSSRVPHP